MRNKSSQPCSQQGLMRRVWHLQLLLYGVTSLFSLLLLFSAIDYWPFSALRMHHPSTLLLSIPDPAPPFKYRVKDNRGREVFITELLVPGAQLAERAQLSVVEPEEDQITNVTGPPLLLMFDLGFSGRNLRGCPDWNCTVSADQTLFPKASAVFFGSYAPVDVHRSSDQYFVHYSQESPVHAAYVGPSHFFNMSFGFRMDTPAASPYGFAARLAPESRPKPDFLEHIAEHIIRGKSKPVAWFVSHCGSASGRDWIAKEMQKHIQMDVYGSCGPLRCPKGVAQCTRMLDTDYFFYFAAENSICRDYLTEKIWDQGLDSLSVPIVLRRFVVEHLLPPLSFIAVDDFPSVARLAEHLLSLINNPSEYIRYFAWRTEYVVIKLNGQSDPRAERLFGMCQVCRLTRVRPRPTMVLPAQMDKWWGGSCERSGALIRQMGIR